LNIPFSRRDWLTGISATTLAGVASAGPAAKPAVDPFTYCLNTSTIRGQGLSIVEEVTLAAKAGYCAIEPWINELDRYVTNGGNLRDLRATGFRGVLSLELFNPTYWKQDALAVARTGLDKMRAAVRASLEPAGK